MPAANTYEVVLDTAAMQITPEPTASNSPELIAKAHIVSVDPVKINSRAPSPDDQAWKYRFETMVIVCLTLSDGNIFQMELQEVTGQPTWTGDLAGQQQCVADIKAWLAL